MKKSPKITLIPNRSFDRTLGYTVCLDGDRIWYVEGSKPKVMRMIEKFKSAEVEV